MASTPPRGSRGSPRSERLASSEDAHRQVQHRLDLAVTDLGLTQLKNIAELTRVDLLEVGVPRRRNRRNP